MSIKEVEDLIEVDNSIIADDDVLLTSVDVARWLNKRPRSLEKWRREGVGPKFFKDEQTNTVRYRRSDVQAYIEAGMQS